MRKIVSMILCLTIMLSTVVFCLPSANAVVGITYYIDSFSGDDTNDGTSQNNAWQTTANISGLSLSAGDKILFKRGGVYECTITLTCSGTEENPIVISAYGEGERPLLTTLKRDAIMRIFDCSYVTVSDLELTAHNGGGIWVDSITKDSYGVKIENCVIHDMQNHTMTTRDNYSEGPISGRAGVVIRRYGSSGFSVNDLTIIGCEIYDTGNGIFFTGEKFSNKNALVKECYLHDMDGEAVVLESCDGARVTNCRMIDVCQGTGVDENGETLYYNAAAWTHYSKNCVFEHCEIAGQKTITDGMVVDFDHDSYNCTYQYIYSHDNPAFICNNGMDDGNYGNTVRYCLSVNDNFALGNRIKNNSVASGHGEKEMKFYNNTIINSRHFDLRHMYNCLFVNNIITTLEGYSVTSGTVADNNNIIQNNCYYNCVTPKADIWSTNTNPGFAGDDYSDMNSFKLSKNSPLIGKGYSIDDGLSEDIFGEKITSVNIGCYGGKGVEDDFVPESIIQRILRNFRNGFHQLLVYIDEEIRGFFKDLKNKYEKA